MKKARAAVILLHICAMFLLSLIDLKTPPPHPSRLHRLLLEANWEPTLQLLTARHTNEQEMFVCVLKGGLQSKRKWFGKRNLLCFQIITHPRNVVLKSTALWTDASGLVSVRRKHAVCMRFVLVVYMCVCVLRAWSKSNFVYLAETTGLGQSVWFVL